MRNIFDQYSQPENRLTHALISSLEKDPKLLRSFIRWSVEDVIPLKKRLYVIEQSVPNETEPDELIAGKRGLPDAWIYTDDGWSLVIESKVASHVSFDQLKRHQETAEERGFIQSKLLVIDISRKKRIPFPGVYTKTWREIYEWGIEHIKQSDWARSFTGYFEVAETKMVQEKYLKEGTLTKFTGIPFNNKHPYSYHEAKRLLGLILDELRTNKKLIQELGIDPDLPGRQAITGQQSSHVWNYLRLKESKNAKKFEYPHLTLGIHAEYSNVSLTIPNGVKKEFADSLFNLEFDSRFIEVFSDLLSKGETILSMDKGIKPHMNVVQRHYPSRKSPPVYDARISLDFRTAFKKNSTTATKYQPEWLKAVYDTMHKKRSNLQFQVGYEIYYSDSKIIATPKAMKFFEESLLALRPILNLILHRN